MNPMVQTVVRYLLTVGLTWLATKTGNAAFSSPDFVNIAFTAISSVAVAAVAGWGLYKSTIKSKVADLAAHPAISAIVTSDAKIAANANSPKVKAA